jgi:hypothetical protein
LLSAAVFFVYGQTDELDLTVSTTDMRVSVAEDGGFDLFIRKKPSIGSILLTEVDAGPGGQADMYAFRAPEWNAVNGDEIRYLNGVRLPDNHLSLIDSTPDPDPEFGDACHIYIPPVIYFGYPYSRSGELLMEDVVPINIRSFALPYADYSGVYLENRYQMQLPRNPRVAEEYSATPEAPGLFEQPGLDPPGPFGGVEEQPQQNPGSGQSSANTARPPRASSVMPGFVPVIYGRMGFSTFCPGPDFLAPLKRADTLTGDISMTQQPSGIFGYSLHLERDALLMNRLIVGIILNFDLFSLNLGPYFGILNKTNDSGSMDVVRPGLFVALDLPILKDTLSASFRLDFSLGDDTKNPDDYTQNAREIAVSYWFPFGTAGFTVNDREMKRMTDLWLTITNRWTRIALAMENIALPNPRWKLGAALGWQNLLWYYTSLNSGASYWDIYIGLEASYEIQSGLKIAAGLEVPIYPWVYSRIVNILTPQTTLLYSAFLGVEWNIGKNRNGRF